MIFCLASAYVENRHIRPTHLRVRDRSFPAGGCIVFDHLYAKVLRQFYPSIYHVIPRTLFHQNDDGTNQSHRKHSDNNQMKNDVPFLRRKRNHQEEKKEKKTINVTYCCMNKCKPYDLCEL